MFSYREDSRTLMMVERINNLVFFLIQVCVSVPFARILSRSRSIFLVDAHIPVSLVVIGTVLSALSAVSQEICRSVTESAEFSESKSDLGLGIIDPACLFRVAGSDWWANQKLLEDMKREIDETREAE